MSTKKWQDYRYRDRNLYNWYAAILKHPIDVSITSPLWFFSAMSEQLNRTRVGEGINNNT